MKEFPMPHLSLPVSLPVAAAAALLLPGLAAADILRCQTAGYCTNDLECSPDTAVMVVSTDKGGLASFGWDEPDAARFSAQGVRLDAITVYHLAEGGSTQTLVIADNLQATFSVSAYLGTFLYTSFQALTCVRQ